MKKGVLALIFAIALTGSAFGAAFAAEVETGQGISPADLWIADDGISVSANVDTPDYMRSGYFKDYRDPATRVTITEDDLPEYRKNGVYVTSSAGNAAVTYKNVIDISGLKTEDELLSVVPIPTTRGTSSFTEFGITLTDADNPDNYIYIRIFENRWWTIGSLMSVSTQNFEARAYRWGQNPGEMGEFCEQLRTNFMGTQQAVFEGVSEEEMLIVPFSVRYDTEKRLVSICNPDGQIFPVLDLDDGASVGYGNEWQGFENDRVILSISASGFLGAQADFMIFNVAGTTMNGEQVNDTAAPSILVKKTWETPPTAAVGKPYAIFPAEAYDAVDGALDLQVSVRKEGTEEFVPVGNEHIFDEPGTYILRYETTDNAGLTTAKEFTVEARYGIAPMTIETQWDKTKFRVGESIEIRPATVTGGSGTAELTVYAERALTGERTDVVNNAFTVRLAGEYYVRYVATDYLGNRTIRSVSLNVVSDGKALMEGDMMMFERFIDGETYKLPEPSAYDYISSPGSKLNAVVKVSATGTGEKAAYSETVENYLFTPTKELFGDAVKIRYAISCGENGEETVYNFEVPVIEPQTLVDYFVYDEENTDIGYNLPSEVLESYMTFSRKQGSDAESLSYMFIHPFKANGFSTRFSVPFTMQNFTRLTLVFKDAYNGSVGFTLSLEKYNESSTFVYYNGQKYSMSGAFDTEKGSSSIPLMIQYDDGIVMDYTDRRIFTPTVNDDGSAFEGFPSGKVFVTYIIEGITGDAGIKMNSIGSQTLYAEYLGDVLQPYVDIVVPEFEYQEDMPERFALNQRVRIPYVRAYDNLSPYVEVFVTLTAPDGGKIYDNALCEEGMSFVIENYGKYYLSYYAADKAGKFKLDSYTIQAEDLIAPTITLSSDEPLSGKGNRVAITLPDVKVLDNYDENPVLKIFAVDAYGEYTALEGDRFVPPQAGRYIIRYYAYDANYNVTIKDIVCNVK